jgi:two-component system, OmpR family, response regulator
MLCMKAMRVLVLEDHVEVADLTVRSLEKDGHEVVVAHALGEAELCLKRQSFDAAVVDVGLPDGSGIAWCESVRKRGLALPILLLTAQTSVASRVSGLDAGADDFLAKPFAVAELRARVRALGRRAPLTQAEALVLGEVRLEIAAKRAYLGTTEVPLTAREWSIVQLLGARRGRIVSRAEIIERVWPEEAEGAEASLEVLVGRIRKKLSTAFIRTVRGEGYVIH